MLVERVLLRIEESSLSIPSSCKGRRIGIQLAKSRTYLQRTHRLTVVVSEITSPLSSAATSAEVPGSARMSYLRKKR